MLWQKSWWETRWGLLVLMGMTLAFALWRQPWAHADISQWTSSLQERTPGWGEDSQRLLPLLSSHYGYVWSRWFKLVLLIMWPVYAVTLGATLVGVETFGLLRGHVSRRTNHNAR